MAIFRASKGEVMGKEIGRFGKAQRMEYARIKAA